VPRCPLALERCVRELPPLIRIGDSRTHQAACWVNARPGS
jgi:hypothetical protein